jgi:hypothetical protein
MQAPTDEASIPTENERTGPTMSGRRRHKIGIRIFPWETAAAANLASSSPPPQDDDIPAAKRLRLQTSTSIPTASDAETVVDIHATEVAKTASPDNTVAIAPTDVVTVAALLPSGGASCVPCPSWKPEEDAKLAEAVEELGKDWVRVAAMVLGRTNQQCLSRWVVLDGCRQRWVDSLDPNIASGEWTVKEDAKLAEAVEELGKDWVRVAAMVLGRTNQQCRSRWVVLDGCRQRWVDSLDPNIALGKWTVEEDAKLAEAVKKYGDNNWVAVAALVPGRTDKQCRQRWVDSLDPNIKRRGWTVEEDTRLTDAVTKHGSNWVKVAAMVPRRTNIQCRSRWVDHLDPDITSGKWKAEEDAKLAEAVKKYGDNNWVAVAALVPGRTDKQCRKRWVDSLDPNIKRRGWTVEEDTKLNEAVKELGKDWVIVAAMFPGRTKKHCRDRWVGSLDPDITSGKWTVEEEANLTEAVKKYGDNNWVAVAALVPGRNNRQCRHRWVEGLDPNIKRRGWTPDEDAKLIDTVKEHGVSNWAAVAVMVPGRTKKQCRQRWVLNLDPNIGRGCKAD